MKKYIPTIIFALIELFIALGILNSAYDKNLMAALAILYATIRGAFMGLQNIQANGLLLVFKQLTSIKQHIGADDEVKEEKEELEQAIKIFKTNETKMFIRAVAVFIILVAGLLAVSG